MTTLIHPFRAATICALTIFIFVPMLICQDKQTDQRQVLLPLKEYEVTLHPSDFDGDPILHPKIPLEGSILQTQQGEKDSIVIQQEIIQGFRIQLFSTSNFDEANRGKSDAVSKFMKDSVYIVFDEPVYKIRIGDFINRYEANQRLQEIIAQGYRDAWVVPDRIVRQKVVHVTPAH